ncbi:uroporphyrinogen-III C-methyltransferase [Cellvibrio fibrivorans]|uniref:uroporphyrinogen-III C-methyltransferase n=1 Tax=Cellvibrio fibrivorans TaxID=126350 RepID=A0ABU1UTB3_9GAMM|nr:uroporphyrinogen-III C-methyltransferase [Cellvibrio fibrivorans]MDR7088424.1 uroporphyrin-III C-methyltransferase [Cellvibrio fibrivorans]
MTSFFKASVETLPSALLKQRSDANERAKKSRVGKVWLVGAGPGDAELLTVKALRAINTADIIFYDYLVSDDIRALFPKNVPAHYVGKAKNQHSIAQEDLNQLLVKQAQLGLTVCRIKGGDPFIFGRGGEELLELRTAGIEAEVIPGITSASGCSTYADIPLTHRGLSQGCTFVTGHAEKSLDVNWSALAQLNHTLVFYMGLTRADEIAAKLLAGGLAADTPVAIIENGCRRDQRDIVSTLSEFPAAVIREQVQSPALIIVGEVVRMKEKLQAQVQLHVSEKQYLLA